MSNKVELGVNMIYGVSEELLDNLQKTGIETIVDKIDIIKYIHVSERR
jgi:hypothetical protein